VDTYVLEELGASIIWFKVVDRARIWIGCMKKVTPSRPRSRVRSESREELRILSWLVGAGSRKDFSQPMHRDLRLRM
jgi:hypothetical protein